MSMVDNAVAIEIAEAALRPAPNMGVCEFLHSFGLGFRAQAVSSASRIRMFSAISRAWHPGRRLKIFNLAGPPAITPAFPFGKSRIARLEDQLASIYARICGPSDSTFSE